MFPSDPLARTSAPPRRRTRPRRMLWAAAAVSGTLPQSGCSLLLIRELEALLAPDSPDNALFVLDSVLFDLLAPILF